MANNIFDDLIKSVEKLIKKHERGVKQDYKAAYRRLRNKLQKIYADYEDEDDGVKISRDNLKALDREAARIVAQMYKKNETAVQNTLEDVLNTSYKSVNTITSKYNIEAVARKIDANNIIKKQVAGHIWTERIKKYGNDFVYDVHGIIHQGLDNGDTYTTTARKLKERFGKDIGNTMRIARTESARVLEDSKYQAFEDLAGNENVKVFKIWHTMGDEAVRDTHDAMEGVKVLYDEDFVLPSGAKCQYPKGTGVAVEDINCRCYVEYVTELVKDENTKKTTLNNIIKAENVGINKQEEEKKEEEHSAAYNYLKGEFKDVDYVEVKDLKKSLSSEEIIKKISGGDMTEGSCSSLGFAYIANKNGFDVVDYRGGRSREVLSNMFNIKKMLKLPNVKGINDSVNMEVSGAIQTLLKLDENKEYYFAVGRHAAIVKRTQDDIFYLELQSSNEKNNGWTNFKNDRFGIMSETLKERFGCRSTPRRLDGDYMPSPVVAIEVDSFKGNKEFKELMGYINTSTSDEKKGESGHEK